MIIGTEIEPRQFISEEFSGRAELYLSASTAMFSQKFYLLLNTTNDVLKRNASYIENVIHVSTKPTPLYSRYTPSSSEPNFVFLAPLLVELAHLAMFFR